MSKKGIILTAMLVLGGLVMLLALAIPAKAITFGEPDLDNTYQNVGAIVVDLTDRDPLEFCSGTLIAPTVFLTAGHCTDYLVNVLIAGERLTLETTKVSFDHLDIMNIDSWISVEQIITHPLYNQMAKNRDFHDVGLLILAEPVTDLPLANLPPEGFLDQLYDDALLFDGVNRAMFIVAGYGTAVSWPPPETVDNGYGRWFAYSEYQQLMHTWLFMSQNHTQDLGGTCYGDSGGPAFYEDEYGKLWLVGITSWGDSLCVATGFDYRVDTAATLDFIADNLP